MAELISEALNVDKFDLVSDNVRAMEQMDTARFTMIAQTQLAEEQNAGAMMAQEEADDAAEQAEYANSLEVEDEE
jgi:hypothetical protein